MLFVLGQTVMIVQTAMNECHFGVQGVVMWGMEDPRFVIQVFYQFFFLVSLRLELEFME